MRDFIGVIVMTFLTTLVSSEFFDVTTIYRLPENIIAIGQSSTGEVDVPSCFLDPHNSCSDWHQETDDSAIYVTSPYVESSETSLLCLSISFQVNINASSLLSVYSGSGFGDEPATRGSNFTSLKQVGAINARDYAIRTYSWHLVVDMAGGEEKKSKIVVVFDKGIFSVKEISSGCRLDKGYKNVILNQAKNLEVHARTNAIGLPFLMPDKQVTEPDYGVDVPSCGSTKNRCDWITSNWTNQAAVYYLPPTSSLNSIGVKKVFSYRDGVYWSQPIVDDEILFAFEPNYIGNINEAALKVILTDSSLLIDSARMFMFSIRNGYYSGNSIVYKCTFDQYGNGVHIHEGKIMSHCNHVSNFDSQLKNSWTVNSTTYWKLKITESWISLFDDEDRELVKFQYKGGRYDVDIKRFSIASMYMAGTVSSWNRYYKLNDTTGSITSPPFEASSDQVCIVSEHWADSLNVDIQASVLTSGTDIPMTVQPIPGVNNTVRNWIRTRFVASIPDVTEPISVNFLTTKKNDNTNVYLSRLSGCNAHEPEDILVTKEKSSYVVVESGADAASWKRSTNVLLTTDGCAHGGMSNHKSDVCACPAGFTGSDCKRGCGKDRYGQDCGGSCSRSTKGCAGMVLCRPLIGCNCAPGFSGTLCLSSCFEGMYGVDCESRCGHCLDEPCDIYTGICSLGCEPGYYPPLCQDHYTRLVKQVKVTKVGITSGQVELDTKSLMGRGVPMYYQLQYREETSNDWITKELKKIDSAKDVYSDTLRGLKSEGVYFVRAVIVNKDGGSFNGSSVPSTKFQMDCTVPDKVDYQLETVEIAENECVVSWKFPTGSTEWCAIHGFEIHVEMGWRWVVHKVNAKTLTYRVESLLAGLNYNVKVRAVMAKSDVRFSNTVEVIMPDQAPASVVGLKVDSGTSHGLVLSWESPRFTAGAVKNYQVQYQCLDLLACPNVECKESAGQFKVRAPTARLEGLLPFARYNVTVSAISGSQGRALSVFGATDNSIPKVRPSAAEPGVTDRSNSGFRVSWGYPKDCRRHHGAIIGYHYQLFHPAQEVALIDESTQETTHLFTDLEPYVNYSVRIYVESYAGWNPDVYLAISARTKASIPNTVQDLTAYKMGRRMIGLRWNKSASTSGTLVSFTVTHRDEGETVKVTLAPTPCKAWPHLYCHTIQELKPDRLYHVTVQARNSEIDEDGEGVSIVAATRETAPAAPTYLTVVTKTNDSLTVEWGLPNLINGQLRSFLINIEETDSIDPANCCQYFPLREVLVKSEDARYQFQLNDLSAASSYAISVSGKTVVLGAALSITAHTRPTSPVLQSGPRLNQTEAVARETVTVLVDSASDVREELNGINLLVAVPQDASDSEQRQVISDKWLREQIETKINGTYFLAAEWTRVSATSEVTVSADQISRNGTFGEINTAFLVRPGRYRLVQALVVNYQGSPAVGFTGGDELTITG